MIRVLVVDDHAAVRAGLQTVLRFEHGLIAVGAATGERDLIPLLEHTRPNVVVLDYNLPGRDGIELCRCIKAGVDGPAVLMYTAYDSSELALPATLAGADGVLEKSASAEELFEAIRAVARGERALPAISNDVLAKANRRIDQRDHRLVTMLLERIPETEIADALSIVRDELEPRIAALLSQLRVETAASR